jgi:hypothetical protein
MQNLEGKTIYNRIRKEKLDSSVLWQKILPVGLKKNYEKADAFCKKIGNKKKPNLHTLACIFVEKNCR